MEELEEQRRLLAAAAAVIAAVGVRVRRNRERRRRIWTRDWLRRREDGRGVLNMLRAELRLEDVMSFRNYLRMDEDMFKELLDKVSPIITRHDTVMRQCISASDRLSITLRFLASGETYKSLSYSCRIAANTLSTLIPDVMAAIIDVLNNEIKVPSSADEWEIVASQFLSLWNFPHCVGALDGKHINFQPPRTSGSFYRNYKGTDSIILLALSDANCKFVWVNVGVNGRVNDANVYSRSNLKKAIDEHTLLLPPEKPLPGGNFPVPYVIVADDAFPMGNHLMKPFRLRELTPVRRIFNYRLSRARRVVENSFGILANKFRVLLTKINLPPHRVDIVVKACCLLHNFILNRRPLNRVDEDVEEGVCLSPLVYAPGHHRAGGQAYDIREEFVRYFNGIGRVPWQGAEAERGNF